VLPTKERLTRAGLFQRAYSARKSVGTPFFSLYVLPRHERSNNAAKTRNQSAKTSLASPVEAQELAKIQSVALPLVGFVVAKKVSKSACLRNRVKRRLREAYRLLRLSDPELSQELAQWYAMVFVVHSKAFEASWTELRDAVSESIVKAGVKHGAHKAGSNQGRSHGTRPGIQGKGPQGNSQSNGQSSGQSSSQSSGQSNSQSNDQSTNQSSNQSSNQSRQDGSPGNRQNSIQGGQSNNPGRTRAEKPQSDEMVRMNNESDV
jgi:ribonuclease P protein component